MVRKNSNRRRNRRRRTAHAVTRSEVVSGTHYKPPNNIRTVTVRPWNNYSLQLTVSHSADTSITQTVIKTRIQTANGLTVDDVGVSIEFKIISVELYGLTDQTLTAVYGNLEGTSGRFEQTGQCFPAKNQFARLGFVWPLADQSQVFGATALDAYEIIRLRGTGAATDRCLVKFRILWRSSVVAAIAETPLEVSSVRTTRNESAQILDKLDRLCDLLSNTLVL